MSLLTRAGRSRSYDPESKLRSRANYRSRLFERRRFDLRLKFLLKTNGRTEVLYGRSHDLSFSGIGVVLTRHLSHGTPGVLILRFPKVDFEVHLPAVVSHEQGFRCGLEFYRLSGEQKLLIQKICKALPA